MKRIVLAYVAVIAVSAYSLAAERGDTAVYRFPTVTVVGRMAFVGEQAVVVPKAGVYELLETEGIVQVLRRGGFLSSDLYLQGFKRADVGVVVDGVRFPNACPNRMDVPLARVEPLDIAAVVVDYSGALLPGGLGGSLAYQRQPIGGGMQVRSEFSGQFGAEPFWDVSVRGEAYRQRLIARWLQLRSYTDGGGRSFGQLYGYTSDHIQSRWVDVTLRGRIQALSYDARFNVSSDVPFPALMMDERRNLTGMLSFALDKHRLYGVYKWHRMDNGMRRDAVSMRMRTDATTATIGLVGEMYDVSYRFWKAENTMNDTMRQAVIPSVHSIRAGIAYQWTVERWRFHVRAGLAVMGIGDTARMSVYRTLYPETKRWRWYVPGALAVGYQSLLSGRWKAGMQMELTGEAPAEEQLFFALQRPMGRPWVLGNPTLAEPVRLSLRTALGWGERAQLQVAASHVWNYPSVVAQQQNDRRYQTYSGIRAILLTANLSHSSPYVDAVVEYAWGEQTTSKRPLSEIAPFTVTLTGKSPVLWESLSGWVRGVYAAAQRRVDASVQEQPTPDWFRLDAGVQWKSKTGLSVGIEGTNLLNRLYRRHLSYIRNPYAVGMPVYEPGRSIRFWFRWQWEQPSGQ